MGCDIPPRPQNRLTCGFNPRTHMGCDKEDSYCLAVFTVSIHAPTWGATSDFRLSFSPFSVSIHAPTWGATDWYLLIYGGIRFQSTHPHGVRPLDTTAILPHLVFQSTHPHGVRHAAPCCVLQFLAVSIHAPTWGATAYSVID